MKLPGLIAGIGLFVEVLTAAAYFSVVFAAVGGAIVAAQWILETTGSVVATAAFVGACFGAGVGLVEFGRLVKRWQSWQEEDVA